ncbi:hypothetical protein G6F61_015227 [Rhizopus arrhizus]|nr:hypothetical protein G6F61_015227 [Rhizopus arrhizus]
MEGVRPVAVHGVTFSRYEPGHSFQPLSTIQSPDIFLFRDADYGVQPPRFVLSLKAFGFNLTAFCHFGPRSKVVGHDNSTLLPT